MGMIKRTIRNVRFGTKIHAVLAEGECLMYQNVMSCSTDGGRFWCNAIVGLTDKRILIEWQRNKGKDVSLSYEQILSWQTTEEIGGISGALVKILPVNMHYIELRVNEQITIIMSAEKSEREIFMNQLKNYCPQNS